MRFQPILNTIFSKFSGGACPRTPLEGLKKFFLAPLGSKNFFRIDSPPKQKILDRTLADVRWGPHSIARVSSSKTRQVPRFCSRWLNPLIEYLDADAFTASWQNENSWLFPPPYLIPKVLKHPEFSKVKGTLVAPMWTSAVWWPLLTYDGKTFRHEVIYCFVLKERITLFQLHLGYLCLVVMLTLLVCC